MDSAPEWDCIGGSVSPDTFLSTPSTQTPDPITQPDQVRNRSRSSSWQLVSGIGGLLSSKGAEAAAPVSPPLLENTTPGNDSLGFPLTPKERELYESQRAASAEEVEQRRVQWDKLAQELEDTQSLQIRMCDLKAGVAPAHRRWVWPRVCGAHARQTANPELYKLLLSRVDDELCPRVKKSIEKDLPRTFCGHPVLQTPAAVAVLRRVLYAYALHDPEVAYCQAMNVIAALLLAVLGLSEEETCFWVLEAIVQRVFTGYYNQGLEACRLDHKVLCCLLEHQDQQLYMHLKSLPPALEALICWQLTLFVGVLPTESTLRLWDITLASKAGPKVLLRASLALLLSHRRELLEATTPEQCKALLKTIGKHSFDGSSLVRELSNETQRVSWEQLQEWRLVVAAGATDLNLPLLCLPEVLEQGRSSGGADCNITHGTLTVTTFGLTYMFHQGEAELSPARRTSLPFYGIMSMTKQDSPTETCFILTMKDLRHFCFSVPSESASELHRILKSHCTPANVLLYAQKHALYLASKCAATQKDLGRPCEDRADDLQRMHDLANSFAGDGWRLSSANCCLALCQTYPRRLLVPAAASDELLHQVAPFRSLGRIPTISWLDVRPTRHSANCCPFVARSSQPLVGFWGQRSESDEELVRLMREAALAENPEDSLVIIDCRDWLSACANASKGVIGRQAGGTEPTAAYGAREIKFMSMQNIHKVRASLDQYEREDIAGLTSVEAIWNWLSHTRDLLSAAQQVVGLVDSGTSVLIHCSDGWDRTPQVVSLALVLLDPFYRTFEGLQVLVQREWVEFGHKFVDRTAREDETGEERSPIFLQWLSALHEVVCQAPNLFEFNALLLLRLCDAHANGLLPCLLGTPQEPEEWDGNHLVTSWAVLEQDREAWLNSNYTPGHGSVPHSFFQRSAELLLEHSFVARWCLKRRTSPWILPVPAAPGAMPATDGAQHEVLCQELKVALDRAEAQKVNAEQKAATLHGDLELLLRERSHLMEENKLQAASLKLAMEDAEQTRQSLEDQKEKLTAIMSTPHLHLGILLQRAMNESAMLLQPGDGILQGLWLLCALNNTNMEQPRILVLTDKVLLRVKYCFDVSSAPRVVSHTRLELHSDIARLSAGQLQPYWSNKYRYAALRLQTAEHSPTFLQRWVTSVVWSGYPVQIYRSYVPEKCQPREEPLSGPLSVRSFIHKLESVLEGAPSAIQVEHDAEICLEAETQTVFRQTEFPPFWMCDTDMCNPVVSNSTTVDEVEEGDYSVVRLHPQR